VRRRRRTLIAAAAWFVLAIVPFLSVLERVRNVYGHSTR
jgi:hypothetical protein